MSTLENEKKTEAEWFDIFEKDERKERPEKNSQNKSVNAKVNTSKKKTKNQQKQKFQNPKSSTNFFRNIKALNITVNNPESMVSKNKKGDHGVIEEVEKQKPERQSTSSKPPAKLNVIEKNPTSVERIIDEEVEEEADDEELVNLSTYSDQDVDEQEDESSDENTQQKAVKEQKTDKEIQIGNKEAGLKRCSPPKDMELAKMKLNKGKRTITWPKSLGKEEPPKKNKDLNERIGQVFLTLEEKRALSLHQQKIEEHRDTTSMDSQSVVQSEMKQMMGAKKISLGETKTPDTAPKNNITTKRTDKVHKEKSYRVLVEKIENKKSDAQLNRYTILQLFQKIPVLRTIKSQRIDRVEPIPDALQKFVLLHINEKKVAEQVIMCERQLLDAGYQVYEVDNALVESEREDSIGKINQPGIEPKDQLNELSKRPKKSKGEEASRRLEDEEETRQQWLSEEIQLKKIKITIENPQEDNAALTEDSSDNSEEGLAWKWLAPALNGAKKS
ncbi:DNA ligase 1-like [Ambystoma mexicanum]|uniref:DNA ligase 1-like n=1 Tax=Ambystoma mexicanum TaxID=8296 RepID=UPI0037E97AEF